MSGECRILLDELRRLQGVDVCFVRRVAEDHHLAGEDEAQRYIAGTCYPENADYPLFAREIDRLFGIKGRRIAEFCTGPGMLSLELGRYGPEVVHGIDGSQRMIDHALSMDGANAAVRFLCTDLFALNGCFHDLDLVVCQNSLHHFGDHALRRFMEVGLECLRSGGHLYIADYRRESLDPRLLAQRLERTSPHVVEDLLNTIKASFTRLELLEALEQFRDRADFQVFLPDDVFAELQCQPGYQEIVDSDPHPHHLDYHLSLRAKIRKR